MALNSGDLHLREIPCDPEAERVVLAGIVRSREEFDWATKCGLRLDHFCAPMHRTIFRAVTQFASADAAFEEKSLRRLLTRQADAQSAEFWDYLARTYTPYGCFRGALRALHPKLMSRHIQREPQALERFRTPRYRRQVVADLLRARVRRVTRCRGSGHHEGQKRNTSWMRWRTRSALTKELGERLRKKVRFRLLTGQRNGWTQGTLFY